MAATVRYWSVEGRIIQWSRKAKSWGLEDFFKIYFI